MIPFIHRRTNYFLVQKFCSILHYSSISKLNNTFKMLRHCEILFLLGVLVMSSTDAAKLLGIFHVPGKSHYLSGSTLMKILAEKGHDVTIVSPFTEKYPPKNYKEVVLTGLLDENKEEKFNMFDMTITPFIMIGLFNYISTVMVEKTFNNTNFKKLMQSAEKYDAVILEEFNSEALKYVAHHFNAPLIVYSAMDANEWINPYQGNPDSPSYVPFAYLAYTSDMSFFERVYNSIIYVYINLLRHIFFLPMQNRVLHKYYPNAPNLDQFIYNVSLVLLNADESVYDALPRVPSMKNIGGFHIHQPKPLPNDLQQLLDNAEHGVIYFSMGSNLLAKNIPTEKKNILLRTLSKLKQTVLWKYEEENLPGKPENVITRKWFPQNDILAHKNVKLFITHGGIFSTYEAVYHGVPLLSLGVISEQILNSKRSEKNGYAKAVPFFDIEEDTLDLYLKELLENPKYKENAERRSRILKDKPQSPTAAVNYWVEYVVRHKGAPHLRVASLDLTWYQCMLLDVVAFLLVSFVVLIYTMKFLFKTVFGRKVNKKEKTS